MNKLVSAIVDETNFTKTANGDLTLNSSLNAVLDFYYQAGSARAVSDDKVLNWWKAAFKEDANLAIRALFYLRDIREGLGERKTTRTILRWLSKEEPKTAIAIIDRIVEFGRWDDVLEMIDGKNEVAIAVFAEIDNAIYSDNAGLVAKWMPRKGLVAARIRGVLGLNEAQWRKLLVSKTNVVENKMCKKEWDSIDYSSVPSVASGRYAKAFARHNETGYAAYIESVKTGEVNVITGKVEKINTEALYPYSVLKMPRDTAQIAWDNLKDYVVDQSFLPIIDVSGSMTWTQVAPNLQPLDVAISLGAYMAERNRSAFKDIVLSFESIPKWHKIDSGLHIHDRFSKIKSMGVGGSTDFDAAMDSILDLAIKNSIPQADLPKFLIVFSDMQFNSVYGQKTASQRTVEKFKKAGYEVPNIIWWNLNSEYDNVPVKSDASGMILASGFSASLMQNLMSGEVTPLKMMLNVLNNPRYDW